MSKLMRFALKISIFSFYIGCNAIPTNFWVGQNGSKLIAIFGDSSTAHELENDERHELFELDSKLMVPEFLAFAHDLSKIEANKTNFVMLQSDNETYKKEFQESFKNHAYWRDTIHTLQNLAYNNPKLKNLSFISSNHNDILIERVRDVLYYVRRYPGCPQPSLIDDINFFKYVTYLNQTIEALSKYFSNKSLDSNTMNSINKILEDINNNFIKFKNNKLIEFIKNKYRLSLDKINLSLFTRLLDMKSKRCVNYPSTDFAAIRVLALDKNQSRLNNRLMESEINWEEIITFHEMLESKLESLIVLRNILESTTNINFTICYLPVLVSIDVINILKTNFTTSYEFPYKGTTLDVSIVQHTLKQLIKIISGQAKKVSVTSSSSSSSISKDKEILKLKASAIADEIKKNHPFIIKTCQDYHVTIEQILQRPNAPFTVNNLTLLMLAALDESNSEKLTNMLLDFGVNPTVSILDTPQNKLEIPSLIGKTALDFAKSIKNIKVVKILKKATLKFDQGTLQNKVLIELHRFKNLTTNCAACNKAKSETVKLNRCSGCKAFFYCSTGCQRKNWSEHESRCKKLASLNEQIKSIQKELDELETLEKEESAATAESPFDISSSIPSSSSSSISSMPAKHKEEPKKMETPAHACMYCTDLPSDSSSSTTVKSVEPTSESTAATKKFKCSNCSKEYSSEQIKICECKKIYCEDRSCRSRFASHKRGCQKLREARIKNYATENSEDNQLDLKRSIELPVNTISGIPAITISGIQNIPNQTNSVEATLITSPQEESKEIKEFSEDKESKETVDSSSVIKSDKKSSVITSQDFQDYSEDEDEGDWQDVTKQLSIRQIASKDPKLKKLVEGRTKVMPAGRGSTGEASASNLNERLAMLVVRCAPLDGTKLEKIEMGDKRWPNHSGWFKWSRVQTINSQRIEIHYVCKEDASGNIIDTDDFKFKK